MRRLILLTSILMGSVSPAALAAPLSGQDAAAQAAAAQDASGQDAGGQDAGGQDASTEDTALDELIAGEEIVVRADMRGAVAGDIAPDEVLTADDIRSYGASSIGDLLDAISPQTSSARGRGGGRPVILLNGRRISGWRELRDIPTEAIERVDILPEEVALKYGYPADQRVVNFVLRERFRSITGEVEAGMPTAGGFSSQEAELDILRIAGEARISFHVGYEGRSALTEDERDIVSTRESLFDRYGNVTAPDGSSEIDPGLSAIAGMPVTLAGAPAGAADGPVGLGDFLGGANSGSEAPYRTLQGSNQSFTVNGVIARPIADRVNATVNIELTATESESLLGLSTATLMLPGGSPFSPFADDVALYRAYPSLGALDRDTSGQTIHVGASVNGDGDTWRWSVTGNYDRATSETITTTGIDAAPFQSALDAGDPAFNPFAAPPLTLVSFLPLDTSRSTSNNGTVEAQASGPLFRMPAGDVSTSIRIGGELSDYESRAFRSGVTSASDVSRQTASGQWNLDVPIASRREGVLDAIGDLTLNGNVEVKELSDFGTLVTYGYGANWSPFEPVRLIVSVTEEEGAPSATQLGNPTVVTPNVRVFDYTRGESVLVTTIGGGNPGLQGDRRHVLKVGLNANILEDGPDLRFSAEYVRSRTDNAIAGLPAPTAEIEAAFPDRFVRDATGQLVTVDNRSVNFARTEREQIRYGLNFSLPLRSEAPERASGDRRGPPRPQGGEEARPGRGQQQDGAGQQGEGNGGNGGERSGSGENARSGEGRRGPGGGGRRGRSREGRIRASLYHTVHLRDEVLIREGLPVLDLLGGSATGNSGGQPRHEIELDAGVFKNGLGFRIDGNWQSATRVDAGTSAAPEQLRFGSLATVDARLFVNLGEQRSLVRDHRWLRGARVSFSISNIFDARRKVTDATGAVPLSYQPDLIDPVGRRVEIEFRKLFF
ncbi:TonB-dependent receptor plug domain-containing protein [Stakelama tenebrarum]|uniref:TonB-dependent receptor plug domain-containing protein n=1 Tax=Stakelama tenebrarum TaxID=2711215 RepID=A0A6G6Y297_9SPHN|nr:TonB-dependent receptor plug domain-containing protein [Sphingosinithalassobacter tenebrarum]QIG78696.1 TonB-dependent receptor plug domain-containing protein [Sphingosinithalassobacter tenebrarum]